MVFIFAVSNHHSGTYDSRQAQGPGTVPRETPSTTSCGARMITDTLANVRGGSEHARAGANSNIRGACWQREPRGHRDRCVLAHGLKSGKLHGGHTGTVCLRDE